MRAQVRREPVVEAVVVGRVEEHEVVACRARRRARGRRPGRARAPSKPQLVEVAPIVRQASRSDSTNTQLAAPRESASSPIAPEPAKRSITVAPSTGPDQVERRLAHEVGRRPCVGALRRVDPVPLAAARDDPHAGSVMRGAGPRPGSRPVAAVCRRGQAVPGQARALPIEPPGRIAHDGGVESGPDSRVVRYPEARRKAGLRLSWIPGVCLDRGPDSNRHRSHGQ